MNKKSKIRKLVNFQISKWMMFFIFTLSNFQIFKLNAQAPQAIPYQAVARDAGGNILANQNIGIRFTIIDSNINSIDYQETHLVTTNALGLFTLNIGQGTPVLGTLSGIYWPISGNEHVQVEMDATGGTNYTNMGITKFNSVPFALHANTSSDNKWNANGSNIYNNNSGNVGIGTSTPNAPLQFSNTNLNRKIVLWDGNNNDHQFVGLGTSPGILRYQVDVPNSNHVFYAGSSSTSSNELMRISGNGNVGIGTASPSAKLDVNGMAFFRNNSGGSLAPSVGTGIKISTENNKGNIFGYNYANYTPIDLVLQGEGANVGIGNHFPESTLQITKPNDATTLTIGGNSQAGQFTALRLQTSANSGGYSNIQSIKYSGFDYGDLILNKDGGNIGIGTASPLAKLDIAGNVKIADGTQGSGKILTSDANGIASWQAPTSLTETDPKVGTLTTNKIPRWNASSLSNGSLYDNGTQIGLGTTSPTEQLHTTGGVRHEGLSGLTKRPVYANANGKLSAGLDTIVTISTQAISYNFPSATSSITISGMPISYPSSKISVSLDYFWDNIKLFLIAPNGDVLNLINTTTPTSSSIGINCTFNDQAYSVAPTNQYNYNGIYKPTGAMTTVASTTPTVSTFTAIGGGTINPNGIWTLVFYDDGGLFGIMSMNSWGITMSDASLANGSTNYLAKWNQGTLSLTSSVYDNGKVGILTSNPQRTLDVHGDIAQGVWTDNIPSRRIGVMDATTHVAGMEIENTTLSGNYSQKLHLLTHHYANSYGRRFTIDEDGKVGIGTENPASLLDVAGIGKFGTYLKIGSNTDEGYFQNAQDGAYRALQTGGNQGYFFQNYNGVNTTMYVGLNGTYQNKVGIGTATPQANLQVVGSTKTSTLQITNGASNGAVLTSDATGNASWTAPVGCVIRAQTFTASASGTGYAAGGAFAPTTITTTGIYGDTRLINSGAMNVTTGSVTNTGLFTAPSDGYYQVCVKAISVASSVRLILLGSLNGASPVEILDQLTSNPCANCSDISHTQIMYMQAGDTHRILRSVSGTAINDMVISYRKL